jgi:hypothetical protein
MPSGYNWVWSVGLMSKNLSPCAENSAETTRKQRGKRAGGVSGKGFQPGVSGNPNGRPRTAKFSEAAREILAEIDAQSGETNAECVVRHCFKKAMRGSARHLELLLAYAEGKAKQIIEASGPNGTPLFNLTRDEAQSRILDLMAKVATADPALAERLKARLAQGAAA